jgi:hypothetical protein
MRGEAKIALLQASCISLPRGTALWTRIVSTSAFSNVCFVLPAMLAQSSKAFASTFAWSYVNPLPNAWNASWSFRGTFFTPDSGILNGIHVPRPVECQPKMTKVQDDQAQAKRQKMLNLRISPQRPSPNNTRARSYGVFQKMLTENLNTRSIASMSVPRLWHLIKSTVA